METFPVFSPEYREHLVTVIEEHFLNREIGEESPDLFLLSVRRRLRRKMPIFNKMYVQMMRNIDPLITTDMFSESSSDSTATNTANSTSSTDALNEGTSQNTSDNTTNATNKSRGVASNNPQVRLAAGQDYASSMSDSTGVADSTANTVSDASESSQASSETTATDTNTSDSTNVSSSTMKGTQGSPADLIARYLDVLVNVDDMVVQELSVCFMQVWNTSHSYSDRSLYY